MELINSENENQNYKLNYVGSGSTFFGILVANWFLTVITLGLYYPWAKEKKLKYIWQSTVLNNDAFSFHGTGKEMFKGFIKSIAIFVVLFSLIVVFSLLHYPIVGFIIFYVCILLLIPIAIHGSYRYRMSRTSWRGIRLGYRGNRNELFVEFIKGFFLTIITLGIYGAWFTIKIRNYILSNIKFGNLKFEYKGDGLDYFLLIIKGYLLTILTLGIYLFRWQKELFAYYIDNLSIQSEYGGTIRFKSTASGFDFFKFIISNILLIIFTFGIGYAWAVNRTFKFVFEHIQMEGDIDLNSINQTEEEYKDATGEDFNDLLDINFIV